MSRETFTYDNLLAGSFPAVTGTETLVSGQNLSKGAALGKITASGKMKSLDSTNNDGSENPYAILAEDKDASGGDKTVLVYYTGVFNSGSVTFGGSDTASTHFSAFRDKCIFLKDSLVDS